MTSTGFIDIVDAVAFIASVASLILAVLAIWLSFLFFKMSCDMSDKTTEAARDIGSSVDRVEKLFDKFYADTFSMMRDTFSELRRAKWPTDSEPDAVEETEKKADQKITEVRTHFERKLAEILEKQATADHRVTAIHTDLRQLIDRAIETSRNIEVEASSETAREHVLRCLRVLAQRQNRIVVDDIVRRIGGVFSIHMIIREVERLRAEGTVATSTEGIGPDTEIRLTNIREISST